MEATNEKNKQNTSDFTKWVKLHNVEVLNSMPGIDLKIGDTVTYTNDFGVKFKGYTILGFCSPDNSRCVFLNKCSYWFPVDPLSLTIEN